METNTQFPELLSVTHRIAFTSRSVTDIWEVQYDNGFYRVMKPLMEDALEEMDFDGNQEEFRQWSRRTLELMFGEIPEPGKGEREKWLEVTPTRRLTN